MPDNIDDKTAKARGRKKAAKAPGNEPQKEPENIKNGQGKEAAKASEETIVELQATPVPVKAAEPLPAPKPDSKAPDNPDRFRTSDGSKVVPRLIQDEMRQSYLDYAMSVIIGRALPDVRDGLKPVHRRILFAMNDLGMHYNKPYKKSARIVGEVLGKYHPHGDSAVYDTLVRMAQDFSLRYTLIEGQGNFGSIDGDSAAAMRYCVTGDTLITTDSGLIPIKSFSNKKEASIDLGVLTFDGRKKKAVRFFNSGKHDIIQITTELGYTIKGSRNHPVLCWTTEKGAPKLCWKLLEHITKDDIVMLSRQQLFASRPLDLKPYWPRTNGRKKFNLPVRMSGELSFLLGALVSEGSFHQGKIIFNNSDLSFYNEVKRIVYVQFPGITLYERAINGDCLEFEIYHKEAVMFLVNLGLAEVKSDRKEIPFAVLQSNKEAIAEFLKGLFEGDGSALAKVDKRHGGKSIELTYSSKSVRLIEQLKILLLGLGIATTKPYIDKRNGCLKLMITGYDSIRAFENEIGFFSQRKKDALSMIRSMNDDRMSKTDIIPFFNEFVRKKGDWRLSRLNFDRYNRLEKNIDHLSGHAKQLAGLLLEHRFLFNKIVDIKKLPKEEVFSVKVNSKCHSFVANGFINHNTEARLDKISNEMLADIDKETVGFVDNFDGTLQEPVVLPSKLPNLLINGSSGIAVGMATNIPPHNVREICQAITLVIDNPETPITELMQVVKGPDFPTGGLITGKNGILSAYQTGNGKVVVRGKTEIEKGRTKDAIIITEIPYMVNKSVMIEEIVSCINEKTITDISDIRDESGKEGIRVVVELKKDANQDIVLNQLYKHSSLQMTFGINMLALVDNQPKVLNLKDIIINFVRHRRTVIIRRTEYDLKKALEREHILEGLIIALNHIDAIIATIRKSKSVEAARTALVGGYSLTEIQANAILDMRLQKLTSLEQDKIRQEKLELEKQIADMRDILDSEMRVMSIIKDETLELDKLYGDERRTEITDSYEEIDMEDLIPDEQAVVTISHSGYIKRTPLAEYKTQRRGGKGIIAATTKEQDFVENMFVASTHDVILFFTSDGQVHWLKVYQIPDAGRYSQGKAIVNLLSLKQNEKVSAFIPVREYDDKHYLVMATKNGILKKTTLSAYSNQRSGGIRAITLDEGDELVNVVLTDGAQRLMLATKKGIAIRFDETDARPIGRTARGVIGINLEDDDHVVGLVIAEKTILTVTENGYGKRSQADDYRLISRGGKGVINIQCTERNGNVVTIMAVDDEDELMLISKNGIIIRTRAKDISVIGRNTQGLRLMKLDDGDKLVASCRVQENGQG